MTGEQFFRKLFDNSTVSSYRDPRKQTRLAQEQDKTHQFDLEKS